MSLDQASLELANAIAERTASLLQANPPAPTPFLTSLQADAVIGADPGYLQHLRHVDKGPDYIKRSAKMVRYELQTVRDWMLECIVEPGK